MKMKIMWLKGMLIHLPGTIIGAFIGATLTVSFLALLGSFIAINNAMMTARAIQGVPVDWQVQLASGADANAVKAEISRHIIPRIIDKVGYAQVTGFRAQTGGTVQITGAGQAVGISDQYFQDFPAEVRPLVGAKSGVLLAQQTASNLHAKPGDSISILRNGLPPVSVKVDGIVDLPNADSLFQAVGVPAGVAPQAPPDNVVILPEALWKGFFIPQSVVRPDSVKYQYHVRLGQKLPGNPEAAYKIVAREANNLEARTAGSAMVGNNLASRLLSVSEDALYSQVLFLFLGFPGVILVISMTLAISGSGEQRRAKIQALLRMRGVSLSQIMQLEMMLAALAGIAGILAGLGFTFLCAPLTGITYSDLIHAHAGILVILASILGMALALFAVFYPSWTHARSSTVVSARAGVRQSKTPYWQLMWLDVIILALGAVEFWRTASSGYQVVLAPEGVAASSVNYEAFIAPFCLWVGGVLFGYRLTHGGLKMGAHWLKHILSPLAHSLSGLVSGSISRQRGLISRGIMLTALATSFAVSTSIFDATYSAQSRVDAELTNGADITATGTTAAPPGNRLSVLRGIPGVLAAESMQHRFAYVGNDLQDIYGIDPANIGRATDISNAFFGGGNARKTLHDLARTKDGVLVSEETVRDFQLMPGDLLNLRVQFHNDHQYHVVPFHYVGIAREFPTAPRDSFLVVNSKYLSQQTRSNGAEVVLLRVKGNRERIAMEVRARMSDMPGVRVTDLGSAQRAISSSLTAIDLKGLTRVELAFAILLVTCATGLILGLGMSERKRMFAILSAIGANSAQLGSFLWGEALVILIAGCILGSLLGVGVAEALVKMLTGIFDPPPESLSYPVLYLAFLGAAAIISTILTVVVLHITSRRHTMEALRGL
jgi:putative ABC transport system permease protein